MAGTHGLRFRRVSAGFGIYLLVAALLAFYVSPTAAGYVDSSATPWMCTTYLLLGALALVGVCVGAVRRAARLDARIDELDQEERWVLEALTVRGRAPSARAGEEAPIPSDEEVDRLLDELHRLGAAAAVEPEPGESTEAALERALDEAAELRERHGRAVPVLRWARTAGAAAAAGPAVASLGVIGLFAALLPAADGPLLADPRTHAFLALLGVAWLAGVAGYAAAAFRRLRPQPA